MAFTFANEFAERIYKLRYAFDENESWEAACQRVAAHVSKAEEPNKQTKFEEEFYEELSQGRFMPGGRIWYGAGRNKAQLINCFVLPSEDSREGWGDLLRNNLIISGTGGGVGINFSPVRPRGTLIAGTGGEATGSVSLMNIVNGVCEEIKAGGGRRSALMFCLNSDHPDILEFLNAKLDLGKINNANISIVFMNESPADFFEKVKTDGDHHLMWKGKIVKTIKARELWDILLKNALKNGEPGILNGYLANEQNNIAYCRELISTNPCVSSDTWVMTSKGAKQVSDLIGTHFAAAVDGNFYNSTDKGFFATGEKQLLKITTNRGYDLRVTENHEILVERNKVRTWVASGKLEIGDKIVINDHEKLGTWDGLGKYDEGYMLGALLGDGHFVTEKKAALQVWGSSKESIARKIESSFKSFSSNDMPKRTNLPDIDSIKWYSNELVDLASSFGMTKGNKIVTKEIETSSYDFYRGFLQSWFDADGSVQGNQEKGVSVRLSSSVLLNLKAAQRMLSRMGIISTIYANRRDAGLRSLPDGRGGYKEYDCNADHELVISNKNLTNFYEIVGFASQSKQEKLGQLLDGYKRTLNRETFLTSVTNIEKDGIETVYDCTVPGISAFDANGLYVHNCGEIFMQAYSVCCLGAVVLPRFVKDSKAKNINDRFDWGALHTSVGRGVRFLDNVLTVNHYPIPETEVESKKTRRVGLGIMGLHDMLLMLGLKYSSQEGRDFVSKVMSFIKHAAYDTSTYLALEKGAFPEFDAEKFLKSGFVKGLKPSVRNKIRDYGMRNCALLTIAPTGTTSIVQGVTSGIEPIFACAYNRKFKDSNLVIHSEVVVHPLFEQFVNEGLDVSHFEGSDDVEPREHFLMQAICQQQVDNAISKTVNIPQEKYTPELLSDLYMEFVPQLKGTTIYPVGSRQDTPLEAIPLKEAYDLVIAGKAKHEEEAIDTCVTGVCGF